MVADQDKEPKGGQLPSDWGLITVGELVETDPETLGLGTPPTYAFRYIALEDVDHGSLEGHTECTFATAPVRARRKIRLGDILVSTVRPNLQSHLLFEEEGGNWVCSTGFCVLRPIKARVDTRFLFSLLFSRSVTTQIDATIAGSNYPAITRRDVQALVLPMPPTIEEQRAIAGALRDVDAVIESLEKLIAKKRDVKQATMQQLLTGQTRLLGFTGEWQVRRFDDLFRFSGGYSASREQLSSDDGYCYLHYGDIHGAASTVIDASRDYTRIPKLSVSLNKVNPASLLADGDVVFVDASEDDEGTSRHVVVCNPKNIPFISGLHTIVAKPLGKDLDRLYSRYCFQSLSVRQQFKFFAVGTKVSGISKTNIAKIEIKLPEKTEQQAIAQILVEMDSEIRALTLRLSKTREIRQGMMQQLLTGRIRLVTPTATEFHPAEACSQLSGDTLFDTAPYTAPLRERNRTNEDAAITGYLAYRFGSLNRPLGNVRRIKLSYLLRRYTKTSHDGYIKKAAGPYDPSIRYGGALEIALTNHLAKEVQGHHKGKYKGLTGDTGSLVARELFDEWFGKKARTWLDQFEHTSTDELECLATVDLALLELRAKGEETTVSSVKAFIGSEVEWIAKLSRPAFTDTKIAEAIRSSVSLFGKG